MDSGCNVIWVASMAGTWVHRGIRPYYYPGMGAARHCGGDLRPTSCSARALSAVCRHTPTCAHPVSSDEPPVSLRSTIPSEKIPDLTVKDRPVDM